MSPALKCLPSKGLSHLCYAAVSRIIPSDEPQGAALYCFDRCNVLLLVGGPSKEPEVTAIISLFTTEK